MVSRIDLQWWIVLKLTVFFLRQHSHASSPELVLFLGEKVMVCASELASLCGSSSKSEKEACDIDKVRKMIMAVTITMDSCF